MYHFRSTVYPYQLKWLGDDLLAALIVTVLITPQSMAYAILAGMPAQAGLYSALLPVVVYALLGSSPLLAVGPVAIISLMTFEALHQLAAPFSADYAHLATTLALLVGFWLLLFWLIDLGRWTTFLSQTVLSAFTSATALLIVASQLHHIFGVQQAASADFWHSIKAMIEQLNQAKLPALIFSSCALLGLYSWQKFMPKLTMPLTPILASLINKSGPLIIVIFGILSVELSGATVSVVGELPTGLPALSLPSFELDTWSKLFASSGVIALIGYLSSLSASEALGQKNRAQMDNNQELLALGASNIAAALSQSFPIAGSFSRSVVNLAADAKTQVSGVLTAIFVALICLFATSLFANLPHAILAVIIILSAWPLVRFDDGLQAWRYQKSEGLIWLVSYLMVLISGAEKGILLGMLMSLMLYLKRTSEPHIAEVGRVPGTDHFRNILRYDVITSPNVMLIRIDENLYFANCRYLKKIINQRLAQRQQVQHVVLVGNAINHVDFNAYQILEELIANLKEKNIVLHLAEFKNTVLDPLKKTALFEDLSPGRLFFTASEALRELGGH